MKKIGILIIMILALGVTACNKETGPDIDIFELKNQMLSATNKLPALSTIDSKGENAKELFASLSNIDYGKVEDYFFCYSEEGLSLADEIAVIKLKSCDDVDVTKSSLKKHLEGRISMFENYEPSQVDRAKKGLVFAKGRYVVLIVAKDDAQIKAKFEEIFETESVK